MRFPVGTSPSSAERRPPIDLSRVLGYRESMRGAGGVASGGVGGAGMAGAGAVAGAGGAVTDSGIVDAGGHCPAPGPVPDTGGACAAASINVVEQSPCVFSVPVPPSGQPLDPNKLNFSVDGQSLGNVCSAADCGSHQDGWYYDDNVAPTEIVLCPDSCALAGSSSAMAKLSVGCPIILAKSR